MAVTTKEKDLRFDQVKLSNMQEPLTIRVEKRRGSGNLRQPIELPAKGSNEAGWLPPGAGWTRDEVMTLENFVLTKWSGGGYYLFTITDAKNDIMSWESTWDIRLYPEKAPPNTAEAMGPAYTGVQPTAAAQAPQQLAGAQQGPQQVPAAVQPMGMNAASGWPNNFAAGYNNPPFTGPVLVPPQQSQPQAQPQQQPMQLPQMWNPNGFQNGSQQMSWNPNGFPQQVPQVVYTGSAPAPQIRDDRSLERARQETSDKEKRDLEALLRAEQAARKDQEHRQQMERQAQVHEQQMKALQEELRRIADTRNKGDDDEVRKLREERDRDREQRAADQAAFQQKMLDQQMQMLQAQIAKLSEAPKGESDEFRQLRADQERMRQEAERTRQDNERVRQDNERKMEIERADRERERERHLQERRDELLQRELKDSREAMERRFEAVQAQAQVQAQQALAAQANRANDPMIDVLKENARVSAENMREMSRMQQMSSDKMAAFMTSPAQLATLLKDQNSGSDLMMRNLVDTVGGIGNMYRAAAEQVLNMSGGGGESPAVRLVQEGLGQASNIAEKYLAMKRDAAVSEGKVKSAEAQRDATRVAAQAQVQTAQVNAQAQARWSVPPPVTSASSQTNGVQARPAQAQPAQAAAPTATPAAPAEAAPVDPNLPESVAPKPEPLSDAEIAAAKLSAHEEEIFGIALESVYRLRKGVADGQLTPVKAIDAIIQGVNQIVGRGLKIPAFTLFTDGRWADFVDVLIPAAAQPYKDECVQILLTQVEQTNSPTTS